MTRDEAVQHIQDQLGFRTDLNAVIVRNMKLAQTVLESEPTKPWFLVSEQHYIRTTISEDRLVLPTGFLREIDSARFVYVPEATATDTTPVDLVKDDYDVLAKQYATATAGPPEAYALMGDYFRVFPLPDALYLIKMIFYKQDTVLDANIENDWLKWAPLFLMGVAGLLTASAIRDTAAADTFKNWENRGRLLLYGETEAREHANRVYQIGGPT